MTVTTYMPPAPALPIIDTPVALIPKIVHVDVNHSATNELMTIGTASCNNSAGTLVPLHGPTTLLEARGTASGQW